MKTHMRLTTYDAIGVPSRMEPTVSCGKVSTCAIFGTCTGPAAVESIDISEFSVVSWAFFPPR